MPRLFVAISGVSSRVGGVIVVTFGRYRVTTVLLPLLCCSFCAARGARDGMLRVRSGGMKDMG